MTDLLAMFFAFFLISAAETITRNRAIDRKIQRKRAVVEFSVAFFLILSGYVTFDIGYREWAKYPPSPFLHKGTWFVFGIGMLGVYIGVLSSMLRKINEAGVYK
jgi:hypothetical protein